MLSGRQKHSVPTISIYSEGYLTFTMGRISLIYMYIQNYTQCVRGQGVFSKSTRKSDHVILQYLQKSYQNIEVIGLVFTVHALESKFYFYTSFHMVYEQMAWFVICLTSLSSVIETAAGHSAIKDNKRQDFSNLLDYS